MTQSKKAVESKATNITPLIRVAAAISLARLLRDLVAEQGLKTASFTV